MRTGLVLAGLLAVSACKDKDEEPTGETGTTPTPAFHAAADDPAAAFMSVGGAGPDDVWLVGATPVLNTAPRVLHVVDGVTEAVTLPTLHDVWWVHAFASGTTFFGGGGATVVRGSGGAYERLDTPGFAGQTVFGVWGAAEDDVWAVGGFAGRAGFAWHWDGAAWADVDLPADLPRADDGEIPSLFKVWGRATDDVYIVGGVGTILHWDGATLANVDSGTREQLFTVHGDASTAYVVGGSSVGVALRGDAAEGFVDVTPPGAPLLQALHVDADRTVWAAGAGGAAFRWPIGHSEWDFVDLGFADAPDSIHALWSDGTDLWAVGGGVLTPALDAGVAATTAAVTLWTPPEVPPPSTSCPADAVDPFPTGSIARRWSEQLLNSVRRDIPNPPVHARNLHTVAVAMYDAWATYDTVKDGVVYQARETAVDVEEAREIAISYAAYRVLVQRYTHAQNAAITLDCYDAFMDVLDLDPTDVHTDGTDPVAVGNRVGQAVIDAFLDDGANEANGYADTTGWTPTAPVLVVDHVGTTATDPNVWQQLNLATAETQNGIVLDSSIQPYIGPHWREVRPFAAEKDPVTGLYSDLGEDEIPDLSDPDMVDWVVEVIVKTAELDHTDGAMIDISPNGTGNNSLGANDGAGYAVNPVTGQPYAPVLVPRGDATRVIAEMWADGPKSETPPGHWAKLANEVSDRLAPEDLVPFGEGEPVDRLQWDVGFYLTVTGATHDAAISAWELKRTGLSSRPITLIRWMAGKGQRTDPGQPSYDPDGLPLVPGVIELITEASSAPGQRHHHLRWYVGELAVWSWPGEPGNRASDFTELRWMRALDWIPYQRRTFVTPAFPAFTSGHSTFSRAAAEAMTAYTGSPWFPEGLHEFVAPQNGYLVFEDGPSVDVHLQWASYYDAADQAGQSRLWGGIHIWADDRMGRINGSKMGIGAAAKAKSLWDGAAIP